MDWPARQPPSHGNFVFDLGIRLRRRLELAVPGWISFSGWTWYRRFVGIRADVYRRNCACKIARTPGRSFPVQCSVRHSPRLFLEFLIGLRGFGAAEWRWELGVTAIPAALFFLLLFGIPRSPRWLAKKGRITEARGVLQMIGEENFEQELQEIVESIRVEQQQAGEALFTRTHLFPIFLAVTVSMFNQLAGINAILYYLNDIFAHAGISKVSANLHAVAVGGTDRKSTRLN